MQAVAAKSQRAIRARARGAFTVKASAQQAPVTVESVARVALSTATAFSIALSGALPADAFPIFAQQNYKNPREANGRLVCANCHLASKPVELEIPQAVLPDSVFEATVKIPYNKEVQQVQGTGKKGGLNVGFVMILPEGFEVAPADRVPEELQAKTNGLYFQPYSPEQKNIIVVGPVPGDKNQEIHVPLISPDPSKDKNSGFLKYPVYLGGNRGRGQLYPDGSRSNNTVYQASVAGTIKEVKQVNKKGAKEITIVTADGVEVVDKIPPGPEVLVAAGDVVAKDQPVTTNPNVGGFGQAEGEIVLQDPTRIYGMLAFFFGVTLTQVMLVLKKKQYEKVQLAEMNF